MKSLKPQITANVSHPYASQLAMIRTMFTSMYHTIPQLITGDDAAVLRLRLCGNLQGQIQFINAQLGEVGDMTLTPHEGMTPAQNGTGMVPVMGPLTSFMGEELHQRQQPVNVNQITASITDVEQLIEARDALYGRFLDMSEDELLQIQVTNPSGTMMLRMVAKKAGLDDYDTRMVDIDYLSDLRELILLETEAAATTSAVDAHAGKQGDNPAATETQKEKANDINEGLPVINPADITSGTDATAKAAATTSTATSNTTEEETTGKGKNKKS